MLEIDDSRQVFSQHEGVEVVPNIAHQMLNENRQMEVRRMSKPNFKAMSRKELHTYVLAH